MKTRNGWVSNSSSCSFLIFDPDITPKEVQDKIDKILEDNKDKQYEYEKDSFVYEKNEDGTYKHQDLIDEPLLFINPFQDVEDINQDVYRILYGMPDDLKKALKPACFYKVLHSIRIMESFERYICPEVKRAITKEFKDNHIHLSA